MQPEVLRIIDANLNRAREALRVIEDYARFALDDAAAARTAKQLRHDLRRMVDALGQTALLSARDIVDDVGRDTKTASELRRGGVEDVVHAAFARLSEAFRVIGEFGKLIPSPTPASPIQSGRAIDAGPGIFGIAATAEQLRYRAYELQQQVALRGTLRARFRATRLYVIITESLCRGPWLETAEAAVRGGAGIVQLREKPFGPTQIPLTDAELLRRAIQLRELTSHLGALFIVNDRPDIARLSRADGIHVGQDDLSVRQVRQIGGAHLLVGKSTHTLEQFESALAEEPDYIAVGPMFPTLTKPQDHVPGSALLEQAAAKTDIPIVAIGGVTAVSASDLLCKGASCVCACSAIIGDADPYCATTTLIRSRG